MKTESNQNSTWTRLSTYLTLSGSVIVKMRRAEHAVSMLGSLVDAV